MSCNPIQVPFFFVPGEDVPALSRWVLGWLVPPHGQDG